MLSDGRVHADEIVIQRFLLIPGDRLQFGCFEQDGFGLLIVARLELSYSLLQQSLGLIGISFLGKSHGRQPSQQGH